MKSSRTAPTPEREGSVLHTSRRLKVVTKRTQMVDGQLCNAYGSIWNPTRKKIYLRGKPSSNDTSQKVKLVKRETAPSSESAQCILAWRSEDSVESAKSSQSEAQPGNGSSAIPEAARSWRQQKARRKGSIGRYIKQKIRAVFAKDNRGKPVGQVVIAVT